MRMSRVILKHQKDIKRSVTLADKYMLIVPVTIFLSFQRLYSGDCKITESQAVPGEMT
mgnify:CR=1 FL=1